MSNTAVAVSAAYLLATDGGVPVGTPYPTVAAALQGAAQQIPGLYLVIPVTLVAVSAAVPTLAGFSPKSGAVGTLVTLAGTGLSGATAVKIGAFEFTPIASTTTSVTLAVPQGAQSGNLAVEVGGLWAFDNDVFTVTTPATAPGAPTDVTAVVS